MVHSAPTTKQVRAIVTDVLPNMGMAYLIGEDGKEWTVTKGTPGVRLQTLKQGEKVDLTVQQHSRFSSVARYVDA